MNTTNHQTTKKTAIVHDFFYQNGGAECVVEKLLELYPEADVYTSIFVPSKFQNNPNLSLAYSQNRIFTSVLQGLFEFHNGFLLRFFKHFFWLYPLAMRMMKVSDYDIVIISSTDCAKQIRVSNIQKLIHYCHTPTRYLHGLMTPQDQQNLSKSQRLLMPLFVFWLRWLDLDAVRYLNQNDCIWVANSSFIKQSIKTVYQTNSVVIYPPVEIDKFLKIERNYQKTDEVEDSFYLCHGRISFHKRIDLAILGCLYLNQKLKISGTAGLPKQMDQLQKIVNDQVAINPSKAGLITFLGRTTDEQVAGLIGDCKGFLFTGKEDFGIAPIEILAGGVPIIAYQKGGALEYIQEGINGVFFVEQTLESLCEAMFRFEEISTTTGWNTELIRDSSKTFGDQIFLNKIQEIVNK